MKPLTHLTPALILIAVTIALVAVAALGGAWKWHGLV